QELPAPQPDRVLPNAERLGDPGARPTPKRQENSPGPARLRPVRPTGFRLQPRHLLRRRRHRRFPSHAPSPESLRRTESEIRPVGNPAQTCLGAAGIPPSEVPAKIEGLAFGQDVTVGGQVEHTLYVSNDNDFLSQVPLSDGTLVDNPNQFFVFGFTDADLAKFGVDEFVPQEVAAIPEPSTWAMM